MREQIAFLFPGQPVHPSLLPNDELIEKPVEPDLLLEKVRRAAGSLQRREKLKQKVNRIISMVTKPTFSEEVSNLLHVFHGEPLKNCIQCGTVADTCPVARIHRLHAPRLLIGMINADMKEEVMESNTFWYCASCFHCTVRCPSEIDIAGLMYARKRYSIWKHQYAEDAVGPVSQNFRQVQSERRAIL